MQMKYNKCMEYDSRRWMAFNVQLQNGLGDAVSAVIIESINPRKRCLNVSLARAYRGFSPPINPIIYMRRMVRHPHRVDGRHNILLHVCARVCIHVRLYTRTYAREYIILYTPRSECVVGIIITWWTAVGGARGLCEYNGKTSRRCARVYAAERARHSTYYIQWSTLIYLLYTDRFQCPGKRKELRRNNNAMYYVCVCTFIYTCMYIYVYCIRNINVCLCSRRWETGWRRRWQNKYYRNAFRTRTDCYTVYAIATTHTIGISC